MSVRVVRFRPLKVIIEHHEPIYRGMAAREFFTLVERCRGTNRAARRLKLSLLASHNPDKHRAAVTAAKLGAAKEDS